MINCIKSFIHIFFLIVWTLIVSTLGMITFVSFSSRIIAYICFVWGTGVIFFQRIFFGVHVKVIGLETLPKGPFILASKHESAWETVFFLRLFKNPACIVKRELTYIPVYGWLFPLMGMISIDRTASISSIKKIIKGVKKAANQNRIILIFPEGTRVSPGVRSPLKAGINAICKALPDLPVVAASLNSGLLWPKRCFALKAGTIHVKFTTISSLQREDLLNNLENAINLDPTK